MKYVFKKKAILFLVGMFDAIGGLFFFFVRRERQKPPPNPRSILLIRLDHIGDCFMATALPKIIKENLPGAKVFFLTSKAGKALLDHNPFVDEVISYEAPWFALAGPAGGQPHGPQVDSLRSMGHPARRHPPEPCSGFLAVVRLLRKRGIDVAIGLRGDLRENLLMWLAGIPRRIGYGITGGGFLLTKEIAYRSGVHESEHTADLLQVLGIQVRPLEPQLYFSLAEEKNIESKCAAWGLSLEKKLVGFQVDAGTEAKEWPEQSIKFFLEDFKKHFPEHRLVLTGNDSRGILNPPGVINLVGKTSLRELCVLMKRFTCFIGPDSGPTHIAASLGIPTIFLYSGTNVYEQWKPLFENARVLRHEVPCSPCGLRVCNVAGHPCMKQILSEQVIEALHGFPSFFKEGLGDEKGTS